MASCVIRDGEGEEDDGEEAELRREERREMALRKEGNGTKRGGKWYLERREMAYEKEEGGKMKGGRSETEERRKEGNGT